MNLSAPTMPIFMISLVLAIAALLGAFDVIPVVKDGMNAFWASVAAYVVLLIGNVAKGL